MGQVFRGNAVATIFAPMIMTQTFWYFTTGPAPAYLPGAPFAVAGALMLVALYIFWGFRNFPGSET